jgi:hypothetical protein
VGESEALDLIVEYQACMISFASDVRSPSIWILVKYAEWELSARAWRQHNVSNALSSAELFQPLNG